MIGAQVRATHAADLLMHHALVTGQWSKRVTFKDLTGRAEPLPLDPRWRQAAPAPADEAEPLDEADAMRAWMQQAEAQIRASGGIAIDDSSPEGPSASE